MSVYKPRSRMISIRLSDDEYVGLKRLCAVSGARSVSDLAREAMRVLLNGTNRDDLLSARMEEFRVQMRTIDRKIDQLSDRIASVGNGTKG
jgi:phage host-nuclease inhibitor protein Gam